VGRTLLVIAAAILVGFLALGRPSAAANHGGDPVLFGGSGSSVVHLTVVPTMRSVTVSPGTELARDCAGGGGYTASSTTAMGYPNGTCWAGTPGQDGPFSIAVTYTGPPGQVYVSGSNAVPADNGTQWSLCSPQGQPSCTGGHGMPGKDQYTVENYAQEVAGPAVITSTMECDTEFDPGGGCAAAPAEFKTQSQDEGLELIGPNTWDDTSTSWTVRVTWIAAWQSSGSGS
jgi:hypothetical protein